MAKNKSFKDDIDKDKTENKMRLWNKNAPTTAIFQKPRPWYLTLTDDLICGTKTGVLPKE